MNNTEQRPLVSQQDAYFEIADESVPKNATIDDVENARQRTGSTVFQTSLNIAKLCMGTGCLALPYAAQQGGLIFNVIGLGAIVVWNYYSADCLLRCLDDLPLSRHDNEGVRVRYHDQCSNTKYNATDQMMNTTSDNKLCISSSGPPDGTTTYGVIAWHAFGKSGLIIFDSLMIMLSVGLLIAYQGVSAMVPYFPMKYSLTCIVLHLCSSRIQLCRWNHSKH